MEIKKSSFKLHSQGPLHFINEKRRAWDGLGSYDCKCKGNISGKYNLNLFELNAKNHRKITGKTTRDCKAHNRPSTTVDSELFQGCMQRKLFSRVSLDQNPATYNNQSEVNITNRDSIETKTSSLKGKKTQDTIISFNPLVHTARSREMDRVRQLTPTHSATTPHTKLIQNSNQIPSNGGDHKRVLRFVS